MTVVRTLDRHVFGGWVKLFVLASLGLPLVFILINLTDTLNKPFTGATALVPVQTIRKGEAYSPDWGPYPWGWLPEEA